MDNFDFNREAEEARRLIALGLSIGRDSVEESTTAWLSRIKDRFRSSPFDFDPMEYRASAAGFLVIGAIGDVRRAYLLLSNAVSSAPNFQSYIESISKLANVDKLLVERIAQLSFERRLRCSQILIELGENVDRPWGDSGSARTEESLDALKYAAGH